MPLLTATAEGDQRPDRCSHHQQQDEPDQGASTGILHVEVHGQIEQPKGVRTGRTQGGGQQGLTLKRRQQQEFHVGWLDRAPR